MKEKEEEEAKEEEEEEKGVNTTLQMKGRLVELAATV